MTTPDSRGPRATDPRRRVAYFSANFLPASQTFVYDELTHHVRYEAEAFARGRQSADRFPFERVHTLLPADGLADTLEATRYHLLRRSPRFERLLRDGGFDLIHAQFGPAAAQVLPLADRLDLPMVCTFGGVDVGVLVGALRRRLASFKYVPYYLWAPRMLRRVDRLLAVSRDLADKLVEAGAPPHRVHVFYRGVHVPDAVPALADRPEPLEVLLVGRLVEKKGVEYAIRAFAASPLLRDKARLRVVGDGPLRDSLTALIAECGLGGSVELLGGMPQADVFAQMERAQLAVVPSVVSRKGDSEGVPNVLKEAQAHGLAVVGTRHGGIPEIVVDGETGLLVGERDVPGLTQALERLVGDRELRTRMGGAARRKMQTDFDMAKRMEVLEAHYDAAIRHWREVGRRRVR